MVPTRLFGVLTAILLAGCQVAASGGAGAGGSGGAGAGAEGRVIIPLGGPSQ